MKGISVAVGAMPRARISIRCPPVPSVATAVRMSHCAWVAVRAASSIAGAFHSSSGVTISMPTRPVQKWVV